MAAPISPAARTLGQRIRARRLALGWSQEELADASGLHWSFVSQVERGQRNLGLHSLLKIAAGAQIDPGALVAGLRPPRGS